MTTLAQSDTAIRGHSAPPSDHRPFTNIGVLAIALVFGSFGGAASIAPLDSAAIAPGRVAAESSTKPLQHLEGGIVREILVREAQKVKEGQVLFRLEPTQARANAAMVKKQMDGALAQEARLTAERDGVKTLKFPAALTARRSVPETSAAIADQEQQFRERRASLDNETEILRRRLDQTGKELDGQKRQQTALSDQIENLSADIENLGELQKKGLYPKSKLNALQRERSRLQGQLGATESDIARLGEVRSETNLQIAQVERKFRDEAARELTEVRSRLSDTREKSSVADDVMNRVEIRAPQDGVVQGLKVHTAGAVVKPGETLAELVPTGDQLVMAVKVAPIDIDSVEVGQKAEVRLPAFTSRGLKTILGSVDRVGADAMLDEFTKEPYYLVRVLVDPATVPDEVQKKLTPGMPADVLIITGERTVLQYLIGPLSNLVVMSMREQ